jgi:VanZ family protein
VPKKLWFVAALSWTILIVLLCLISFRTLPSVAIPSADKYVHFTFHFIFTILWFLYFRSKNSNAALLKIAISVIVFSFLLGSIIEIAQEMFTETRQADVMDVAANFAGSAIASLAVMAYDRITRK